MKKAVLKNVCNIHRKTSVLESPFTKVVPAQVFSGEYCELFKKTYFKEYLRLVAYELRLQQS